MKLIFTVFLILIIPSLAFAEVFMYQDASGKWHGVSSIDQVPPAYRSQIQGVVNNDPDPTPAQIKAREEEDKKEAAHENAQAIAAQKADKNEKEAIKNHKKELKNLAISSFNNHAKCLIGFQKGGIQLVDYKIINQQVSVDYSKFSSNPYTGTAYFKVQWDYSGVQSGNGSFIREYSSTLNGNQWGPWTKAVSMP